MIDSCSLHAITVLVLVCWPMMMKHQSSLHFGRLIAVFKFVLTGLNEHHNYAMTLFHYHDKDSLKLDIASETDAG